jgi:hypothetical protein
MKTLIVAGITVAMEVVTENINFTIIKCTALGPTGVRQVYYEVDKYSGEIYIRPFVMGSIFKSIHEEWRKQGIMKRVEIPREVFGLKLGGRPYVRRFFLKEIWKDEVQ